LPATAALPATAPLYIGENGHAKTNGYNGSDGHAGTNGHHGTNGRNGYLRDTAASARERYTARVLSEIPGVQDGGVVSALLIALLEAGEIDGALVAKPSEREPWKGVAHLARTADEVVACAGSFYNQTLALGHLDLKKYDLPSRPRIALVGTPCEIQGLRAMQARPFFWGASRVDAVVLTVALLCTKSFHYEGLMRDEIEAKRGISLQDVAKIDIIRGKLYLYDDHGATLLDEPIRDFHGAALKGCDECADFLGLAADISVGSVGSADGYSSVLVWTDTGRAAFQHVAPRLELRELDRPQAIAKLEALDMSVALEHLKRPFAPHGPLFIDYETHVQHYADTDRAPVAHEPIRY
jgi:coenzyme F420 hydrogenase subunit beta